ncbi:MAG: GAF domain-containing protein [Desulfosarcinaceae bacterium]|nr:GAF domain-containing protein [Desulfosarcinaceae bacterium]
MNLYEYFEKRFLRQKPLDYKLNYIFFLFFMIPIMGCLYFSIKYRLLTDRSIPLFFLGFLAVSLFGLNLLRNVFNDISGFSSTISTRVDTAFPDAKVLVEGDELDRLERSFGVLDARVQGMQVEIRHRQQELAALKSLTELCYLTADADELLNVTLERALEMTHSDIGSILLLDKPNRDFFTVHTSLGLEEFITPGERIPFESSVAKYAVLNKAPMVVGDIERDHRISRRNRDHYGTTSFICMPIKTSRDIIGVMTISSREAGRVYKSSDAEALVTMMSLTGFSYENLVLSQRQKTTTAELVALANVLHLVNSSNQASDIQHMFLTEIKQALPFGEALILFEDDQRPEHLSLTEVMVKSPIILTKGNHISLEPGSTTERAFKAESPLLIHPPWEFNHDTDQTLLAWPDVPVTIGLIPLRYQQKPRGLLVLFADQGADFLAQRHLLQWLGTGLALGIERSRLQEAIRKRKQELGSLKQIGSALASSTFDISQVLNYTMDMIRVIMSVSSGCLYLREESELVFAAAFNNEPAATRPDRLKLGQGLPGYVAARGEAIILNEGRGDSSLFMPDLERSAELAPSSALCVPMISQGKVIGVIEVINKHNGDFTPSDQDLLQSISASVSIAIENANLYKETVAMAENERGVRRMFQKFVPKEVLDQILPGANSGAETVEELRTLTLMNIDLRGFSKLSAQLGPQKTVALLNHFFSVMGRIVFKHGGIVDKYLGDGFLAIFGAPVARPGDADNAITAAVEMKHSLAEINASIGAQMGVVLKTGISVHTGEVVVGNIGFDMKMDYTVIGDSVNKVFRLQDRTKPYPNAILISEMTSRAARLPLNLLELEEPLGETRIFELLGIEPEEAALAG